MRELAYIVMPHEDLSEVPMPAMHLMFGPGRRSIWWRGRKFNIQSSRLVGIEPSPLGATSAPQAKPNAAPQRAP